MQSVAALTDMYFPMDTMGQFVERCFFAGMTKKERKAANKGLKQNLNQNKLNLACKVCINQKSIYASLLSTDRFIPKMGCLPIYTVLYFLLRFTSLKLAN
jgi:hypothetical protein